MGLRSRRRRRRPQERTRRPQAASSATASSATASARRRLPGRLGDGFHGRLGGRFDDVEIRGLGGDSHSLGRGFHGLSLDGLCLGLWSLGCDVSNLQGIDGCVGVGDLVGGGLALGGHVGDRDRGDGLLGRLWGHGGVCRRVRRGPALLVFGQCDGHSSWWIRARESRRPECRTQAVTSDIVGVVRGDRLRGPLLRS